MATLEHTGLADAPSTNKQEMVEELRRGGITLSSELIGTGSFSSVWSGYSANKDRPVAVKLVDLQVRCEYIERFMPRELELIPHLKHPNIVAVYQVLRTSNYISIVQEYAENGNLLNVISKARTIDELEARFLFRQLIEAIIYLERLDIVHRDLKCENIFLDRYNNVKLGDFGFARVLRPYENSDTHCGSRPYVAVELLRGRVYTGNASDIWSAGIVLYIMLTGRFPFNDRKPKEMVEAQLQHRVQFPEKLVSGDARELIRHMLHPKAERRATSNEVIASDWLKTCLYFMRGEVDSERTSTTASSSSFRSNNNDYSLSNVNSTPLF